MSQTIYRTDTSNLTVLRVDNRDSNERNKAGASDDKNDDQMGMQELNASRKGDTKVEVGRLETGTRNLKTRNKSSNSVTWDESAIDNEKMNKRKSKKCCIFHKRRSFGESSSSEDSSCSSDDEEDKCTGNCKRD